MKVFALVILVIGSAASLGSGPYLPSGWRPQGPAFVLPTEVKKTSPVPLKDAPIQESEPAGSDFLREYGPPKLEEVSQDITQQGLPDVVTEQAFSVIEAKFSQEEEVKSSDVTEEVTSEKNSAVAEEIVTPTESEVLLEERTTEATASEPIIQGKSINIETQAIIEENSQNSFQESIEKVVEVKQQESENSNSNVVSTVEERVESGNVKAVEEGVKNIEDALVNLENEIKAQQVQTIEVSEVKTAQETSGSLGQAPEGFLEYGPPGFREYGPPKQEELLRSALLVEETPSDATIETNETRRRRFSPKFRPHPRRKN